MPAIKTIKVRGGVASLWTSTNPILAEREIGIEVDTLYMKVGDGSTSWNSLPYATVSKEYIDALALGIVTSWKAPVKVATTANGTLASDFENGDTVDGVVLTTGDRILLKNQSSQSENGIYVVEASGAPTRSSDANVAAELEGAAVTVQQGTSNANTTWIQTTDGITLGVSSIAWSQLGTSVPTADASTPGITKLYTTPDGANTDGAVSQAGINAKNRLSRSITANDSVIQADDNAWLVINSATPITITLDSLTALSKFSIINIGAGEVTFANGSGVTKTGASKLRGQVGADIPMAVVFYTTSTTPAVGAGTNDLDQTIVVTSGGTIDLDLNNQPGRMFVGDASFASAKSITISNDGEGLIINFKFILTNVAAVLTFPDAFQMQTNDGRWNNTPPKTFTPAATGKHEFSATYDIQNLTWELKATNQYP